MWLFRASALGERIVGVGLKVTSRNDVVGRCFAEGDRSEHDKCLGFFLLFV